jgi:hypothetical protein
MYEKKSEEENMITDEQEKVIQSLTSEMEKRFTLTYFL